MKTGRPRKPTQQQINEGDPRQRGKKKLDQKLAAEPKAAKGLPPCPSHLKDRARAAWKFWAEELASMKLDKRPDGMMLEGACVNYARAVAADLLVEEKGLLVEDKFIDDSGEIHVLKTKKNPAVEISSRAWLLVRAFCSEFGLSPASRTRLTIPKDDSGEIDNLMKALREPRGLSPTPTPSTSIQ